VQYHVEPLDMTWGHDLCYVEVLLTMVLEASVLGRIQRCSHHHEKRLRILAVENQSFGITDIMEGV
jgi:hypothetical protein